MSLNTDRKQSPKVPQQNHDHGQSFNSFNFPIPSPPQHLPFPPLPPFYCVNQSNNSLHNHNFNANIVNCSNLNVSYLPPMQQFPSLLTFPSLPPFQTNVANHNPLYQPQFVPLMNGATLSTMPRFDDSMSNLHYPHSVHNNNSNSNYNTNAPPNVLQDDTTSIRCNSPLTVSSTDAVSQRLGVAEDEEVDDDGDDVFDNSMKENNPWFTEEIADIVKLHRKTARKCHRSKTNKKELKEMCKKLEKKKRKLIKAAKQKYIVQLTSTKCTEAEESNKCESGTQNIQIDYDRINGNVDIRTDVREENMDAHVAEQLKGYLPFYMVWTVFSVIWCHFLTEGNHWKYDVMDILEYVNEECDGECCDKDDWSSWFRDIKSNTMKRVHLYVLNHSKFDIEDILCTGFCISIA